MKVRTSFLPIRLVVEKKSPVTLHVEIKNTEEATRNYSVIISLPGKLGFDRVGLAKEHRERVSELPPNEWGEARFKIYPKFGLKPGMYNIDVYVREHPAGRFDKDIDTIRTTADLRVISEND